MEQSSEEVFETPDVAYEEMAPGGGGGGGGHPSAAAAAILEPLPPHLATDPETVVPTPLDADAAFEVFHGKRYETSAMPDLSGSIAAATPISSVAARRRHYIHDDRNPSGSSSGGAVIIEETPVQRYLRLKAEASELAEDLAALAEKKKFLAAAGGTGDVDQLNVEKEEEGGEEEAGLWHHLANQVAHLKGQLLGLGQEGSAAASVLSGQSPTEGAGSQEEITSIAAVKAESYLAEALLRKVGELTASRDEKQHQQQKVAGSSSSSSAAANTTEHGQVVYELYYDPSSSKGHGSSSSCRTAQLQALEGRLAALETMLLVKSTCGSSGDASESEGGGRMVLASNTLPLVEAIAKIERQAVLLDASAIETLRQRLILLKNEWDDFKKERLKHVSGLERDASGHYRRVEAMYEQLQRLEPMSGAIPQLVARLQVLQGLHAQSLQFNQRMQQLESGQDVLKSLLEGTSKSLKEVKQSLQDNVKQMTANIQVVDERLEGLRLSS